LLEDEAGSNSVSTGFPNGPMIAARGRQVLSEQVLRELVLSELANHHWFD
jgi:hypothetical protein